jgi:hypothetical protein
MSDLAVYLAAIVLPMLATVPLTSWLCHYRAKRHKRVALGTTIVGGSVIPFLMFLYFLLAPGQAKDMQPFVYLGICCFIASFCILAALGVVAYFQKRAYKNADHVA